MAGRLYTWSWRQASKRFLLEHPLCQCPHCDEGRKRVRAAEVVDHDIPHKGDPKLFWNKSNWRALAKQCHDSYKQSFERTGRIKGCDEHGVPLDPAHHWRTRGKYIARKP